MKSTYHVFVVMFNQNGEKEADSMFFSKDIAEEYIQRVKGDWFPEDKVEYTIEEWDMSVTPSNS